ncbi:MAG: DUF423 domain-containing protein [Planctomycetes bacterium]|nr:DUF423 domain-containing protein [Planctomycetota bacterium]MCB9919237.1 DUF423 domain-containing protein [Planctomycetota bacterium]
MKNWVVVGSVFGALAVIAGAFGAHGLSARLAERGTAATFETGAHYHLVHAVALTLCGVLERIGLRVRLAGHGFLWGIVVFSGSLYVLALTGPKWLGAITPIGGTLLIVGWLALAHAAWRSSRATSGLDE